MNASETRIFELRNLILDKIRNQRSSNYKVIIISSGDLVKFINSRKILPGAEYSKQGPSRMEERDVNNV